ncbi:MAG: MFS transporter, partial [Rubripirellula sp.]
MTSNLFRRGFMSLVTTQFFGAVNDNLLKGVLTFMVIDGAWAGMLGAGGQGIVGVCFTVPFILLSGIAGQLADRHSKRRVTQWVKIAEIPIAIIAAIGFFTGNLWITLLALIALTCQSSFFGPAKYGMIPELVDDSDLSRANGSINMMTNAAVIVGTLLAGVVSDRFSPLPDVVDVPGTSSNVVRVDAVEQQAVASTMKAELEGAGIQKVTVSKVVEDDVPKFGVDVGPFTDSETAESEKLVIAKLNLFGERWLPGFALIVIAIAGYVSACFMVPLSAGDKDLKYVWNPFSTYMDTIKEMSKTRLLMVMMAWGYFYLLAGIALFIVPEYTVVLSITRAEASVLMGVLGVAIGVGCAVAGLISGHRIEPRLIPIGALGLIIFFALLAAVPPWLPNLPGMFRIAFSNVSFFILGAGFFAGFYIIPLQALLQKLSPDDERGRFLGTANAVSFTFLTIAALLYWAIRPAFGNQPQNIF